MHVGLLTNLYPPQILGGYELLAEDVVTRLRQRGHRVDVLTTVSGESTPDIRRTLRLARAFGQDAGRDRLRHMAAALWNRRATTQFLHDVGRPDVVLAMSQRRLGLEPVRVFQRAGIPVVFTVNDEWPNAYAVAEGTGLRRMLGRAVDRAPMWRHTFRGVSVQRVVYLSDSVRDQVRHALPIFPEGIVRSQGVDLERFAAREFRPMREPLKLLFVGRLHPTKAPDVALDTLAALKARGVDATLALAGAPVTEDYGKELRGKAASLGIEGQVTWLGLVRRDDLASVYRSADVMLFINRWEEPQGLTYMEAMACGVPVVAFPQGGARELLQGKDVAVLAEACEGSSLAAAIIGLAKNEGRQREMTTKALQMLREVASLDNYVAALESELQAATDERKSK
jgi:glycosyltransferase involved in cell wall biosynthesis